MSAVATVPSLRETVIQALEEAIGSLADNPFCADCEEWTGRCPEHRAARVRARGYRDALELVEATSDNGELLALLVSSKGESE